MQELEKILEEIDDIYVDDIGCGVECNLEERTNLPCDNCYECIKEACKNIIRKHLTDGWIPVEEGLPNESGYYRVTVKNKELGDITEETAWFAHVDDYDMDESEWRELYEYEEVIAWRRLEPYRPERRNNHDGE